jgi:hypothetical protein
MFMKTLSVLMILGLLIGCASSKRNPASSGKCVIEQHSENCESSAHLGQPCSFMS